MEEALSNKNIAHAAALSNQRKEYYAQLDKWKTRYKTDIRDKDALVSGLSELATDVAIEYSSLKRTAKAEVDSAKKTADSRLFNLKKSKDRESGLRESLDSLKEDYNDRLEKAQAENDALKLQIKHNDNVVHELEMELIEAREKIDVSFALSNQPFYLYSYFYCVLCSVIDAYCCPKARES